MTGQAYTATCRGCGKPYPLNLDAPDQLCVACREKIAQWHAPERLNRLAQQGFEEAMGMRPPSGQYPGMPDDIGLRAERVNPGSGMPPQQVTGYDDQGAPQVSPDQFDSWNGNDPVLPGQIRCRHCGVILTQDPGDFWTDPSGSAACPEIGIPHLPLPEGLAGGQ
jgi:hypothetical protein